MTIHALSVGDGILALSQIPGADGNYADDLEHIRSWTPAMVVSLTTGLEMFVAKAHQMGNDLQERGTRWCHMPIEDFGTPDPAFEEKWPDLSRDIRKALSGGGRVLVHCRGGCGRSGMVALRLMIEAGEAPDDAVARLRSVRACAVETDAQMAWALAGERGAAMFLRHAD